MWTTLFGLVHFARAFLVCGQCGQSASGLSTLSTSAVGFFAWDKKVSAFVGQMDNVDNAILIAP